MNLNYFKTFTVVVNTGRFSEAAKVLKLTQPAISFQIQALEKQYGETLLERSGGQLGLTPAGEIFLEYARRIVDLNDELERRIERIREDVSGHLSLEASTIPGEYVLPKVIGRFISEYPAVDVSLSISDTTEVIDHILDRKIDIGFTGALPASKAKRLKFTEFIKDELVIVTPPTYPQAARKQVKIREIMSQPWVLRESGSGTRKTFATALKKAGLSERDLTHKMELASNQAILAAVEAGLGISVISRWAAQSAAKAGAVGMLRISDMDLTRNLYLVYDADKPMSRAEETFIDFVNEIKDSL
jgi:DNA-binding transcriptional LysR family regulator